MDSQLTKILSTCSVSTKIIDTKEIYYIDYEGCPMECSKEEYEKEQDRILLQVGGKRN